MKLRWLLTLALLSACAGNEPVATAPGAAPGATKATAIEVCRPEGQRAYIERLACTNGAVLHYRRVGSVGPRTEPAAGAAEPTMAEMQKRMANPLAPLEAGKPDDHVIDQYELGCGAARYQVLMDMYHCPQPAVLRAPQGTVVRSLAPRPDGCASTPGVVVQRIIDKPAASSSLLLLAPPGPPPALGPTGFGWSVDGLAQALSSQLAEAGNSSATQLMDARRPDPRKDMADAHTATGVSNALVLFPLPEPTLPGAWSIRAMWADARTQQPLLVVTYVDTRDCPLVASRAGAAILGVLREARLVK